MTTPKGMKPFNYDEAIKDISKVVTRDGRGVREMFRTTTSKAYGLICIIDGYVYAYTQSGNYHPCSFLSSCDLFLKDETVVYVGVYKDAIGAMFDTLEIACKNVGSDCRSIAALTISNGEITNVKTVYRYE